MHRRYMQVLINSIVNKLDVGGVNNERSQKYIILYIVLLVIWQAAE